MAPYITAQSYPSYQQPSQIPDPAEQNQVLTQTWLWVPHMKCSLHNDPSLGAIYLIREVIWDGYAKIFRLQQLTSNNHSHNSKRDTYREVSEVELKAPNSAIVDDMAIGSIGMSVTGQLISSAGAGGRRDSVGSAGRRLGISLTSNGAGAQYRSAGAGSIGGGLDAVLYQQQQLSGLHPSQLPHLHSQQRQYGNLGYQNGNAFGGGSRHWQSSNFDNGFLDDERDGGSSGSGSGSGSGRDRRQDRDRDGERDRDRDSDRRGHGREKGRSSKGSGSGKQRGDRESGKDRDRKGSLSPAGRSDGSGRR